MKNDAFEPFVTHLDRDAALGILRHACAGADDGEIFFERRRGEGLMLDDGRLRNASYDASSGFGLRAVQGGAIGYAHSSDINQAALARAADTVRLAVGDGGGQMALPPAGNATPLYAQIDPGAGLPFAQKVALLREIDDYLRAKDKRVVQVSASLAANAQDVVILRPDGGEFAETRPMVRLNISVILNDNGRRESGSAGGGGRYALDQLIAPNTWRAMADEALRIATVNLGALPCPAGVRDVLLGAGWPGILLHEAIGHGLEGDHIRKGSSVFTDQLGQQVAAPCVTVVDDGTLHDRRGAISFDDEGTPSARTPLIEEGRLTGFMQDRQNARLMGVAPTGNGRRESYAHAPMPRMTNTLMLGGETDPKDLLADMTDGIYAVGFGGGQVDITNGKFVFSCTEAYQVKNGQIGAPLKGATLIGDGLTALQNIRALGNDFALDPGMGTCGKAGQWVPVGVGQPSTLIGGLTIGGSKA